MVACETVLVVDDSRVQRMLMSRYLSRPGYRVLEAASGEEALDICRREDPDLIVSDWMMPGMSGLDFCREYRALRGDRYGYFILLTSKSEKDEIARGLEAGADDFLAKPPNVAELRARVRAGERILKMERELTEKNRLVTSTLAELQVLYDAIDRDLVEAKRLQQSLVPDRFRQFHGADVSLMLQPSGHVGGDLVGAFQVNDREIGVYSIDVSGHGITSALMTARLAGYFSGNSRRQNIAIQTDEWDDPSMRSPAEVVEKLNRLVLDEMETEHYLTILLARVMLDTGQITMCQAGHPHPAVQRAGVMVEFLGAGGMPVGLIPGAAFEEFELQLEPGDRLFLGSDGITECATPEGALLDDDGLRRIMERNAHLPSERFFEALLWDLNKWSDDRDFGDDVSGALIEYCGQ